MSKINIYTPTENISSRDIEMYYTAIKEFLINLDANGIIMNIVPNDTSHTLTITSTESYLNSFVLKVSVTSSDVIITTTLDASKREYTSASYGHNSFASNVIFYIYSSDTEFTLGINTSPFCFGFFTATSFSGNGRQKKFLMTIYQSYGSHLCLCSNNPIYHLIHDTAYHRSSFGLSGTYRLIKYPISNTDLLADNIYFADGGTSNPPSRFAVGNDEYLGLCPSITNLCFKLDG